MTIRIRTVDAFTVTPFTGNPAAVVVLDEPPADEWMAAVAREMNLSETAYVIRESLTDADFRLRWFTPLVEVALCGHATLASAHCLLEDGVPDPIRFATRSGVLTVTRSADGSLSMDFPASSLVQTDDRDAMAEALRAPVEWTGRSSNGFLLALLAGEREVRGLKPDITRVARLGANGVIVTAVADPNEPHDFVSRVFAPNVGIIEDPVTGSTHAILGPYWAGRLGRTALVGRQVSTRSGIVGVELRGDRVLIIGRAVTVFDGTLRATLTEVRG